MQFQIKQASPLINSRHVSTTNLTHQIYKIALLTLALFVSACAGKKIETATPEPVGTVYVDQGGAIALQVSGPQYNRTTRGEWRVYKGSYLHLNSPLVTTMPAEEDNEFSYTFNTSDYDPTAYYIVEYAVLVSFVTLGSTMVPIPVVRWQETDTVTWRIYPGANSQTPPSWQGNFIVSNDTDLEKLQSFKEVTGNLSIQQSEFENLDRLNSLSRIGDHLTIELNPNLVSLDGLSNVTQLGGGLSIRHNDNLQSLSGLAQIKTLDSFSLKGNQKLDSLTGFVPDEINSNIYVSGNPQLTSLAGFENIQSLTEDLRINDNANLTDLSGLQGIATIAGDVTVRKNNRITSLEGLTNLTSAGGVLHIAGNPALESLNGLDNLNSLGSLGISSNKNLSDISSLKNVQSLDGYLSIGKNPLLEDFTGLDSVATVGNFYISNSNIMDFSFLSSLTLIREDMKVSDNPQLVSFAGLESLSQVLGEVGIRNNDTLLSFAGLESVEFFGTLSIVENPKLQSITEASSLIEIERWIYIQGNAKLCQSNVEILIEQVGREIKDYANKSC